jgi:hypothetical protein
VQKNFYSLDSLAAIIITSISILLIAGLRVAQAQRHTTCLENGYAYSGPKWPFKGHCIKVENGNTIVVPISSLQ